MTDVAPDAYASVPAPLRRRYRPEDLSVFGAADLERLARRTRPGDLEAARRGDEGAWERVAPAFAWDLLYRLEPELYERLIAGERLHPALLEWIPARAGRALEVAAGAGRLTLELAPRCERLVAVEPAAPLRERLERKLKALQADHVEVRHGFFDEIPAPDRWADLVCTCSAFTPEEAQGGERGLAELERVTAPGGLLVLFWPAGVDWLRARGFTYESFAGEMKVEFPSVGEALEMARIFYPDAAAQIARRGEAAVPYELLGINPPRDLAWKRIGR